MTINKPSNNPEFRRSELAKTLVEMTPDSTELLRSAALVTPDLESLIDLLRTINELNLTTERLPIDQVDLLKRLARMGTDPGVLWKLFMNDRVSNPDYVKSIFDEVAPDVGGPQALYLLIDPSLRRLDDALDVLLPVTDAKSEHRRNTFLNGFSRVDRTKLPQVPKTSPSPANQTMEHYRYSVASLILKNHPNTLTRDKEREGELYDTDILDEFSPQDCYVSIEAPSSANREKVLLVRLVLPFTAEVIKIPVAQTANFEKFLTLSGGQTLSQVAEGTSPYRGSGRLKMLRSKDTPYARFPAIFWKNMVR